MLFRSALNALVLVMGLAVLWSIYTRSLASLLRLAGLAYMLGISALVLLTTYLLVLDVPFDIFKEAAADETPLPVPWHFKLLVAMLIAYLGWRVIDLFR